MSQENVEIVRRLFDAFNQRDVEAARDPWTADAEWRPAFLGGGIVEGAVYRGPEGVADFMSLQDETWEAAEARAVSFRAQHSSVLVEVRLNAIGRGSGIPVNRTTWNVFELRDGKVVAGRVYTREAEALEAVGLAE